MKKTCKDVDDKVQSELAERLAPALLSAENGVQNRRKLVISEKHLEAQMENPLQSDPEEHSGENTLSKNPLFFPPIK